MMSSILGVSLLKYFTLLVILLVQFQFSLIKMNYLRDTAHHGAMYLPKPDEFPIILESLQKMLEICNNRKKIELYPAHEDYAVGKELIETLIEGIKNIDSILM